MGVSMQGAMSHDTIGPGFDPRSMCLCCSAPSFAYTATATTLCIVHAFKCINSLNKCRVLHEYTCGNVVNGRDNIQVYGFVGEVHKHFFY